MPEKRERLGTRLGFLLLSAGCAIGLGNVWRFPYVVGEYGGAAFIILYLLCLVMLGLPILTMEFAVGRASRLNVGLSFRNLEPKGTKWHLYGYIGVLGNYVLMMFYTTVAGWMLAYFYHSLTGDLNGISPEEVGAFFAAILANPWRMLFWDILVIALGCIVCAIGLQKGVERVTKIMMSGLFLILIVLAVRTVTLPGAGEGLKFYLLPDFGKMLEQGFFNSLSAAMNQAFFTLSVGVGSMAIFGSYISRERALLGESINIMALDTTAALMSGLIIFPAAFAFGIDAGQGPGLVFVTLPNIFNEMTASLLWASLFFLFMSFASLTTVVAVFENIISYRIDSGTVRKKATIINFFVISLLSIPCVLGFNLWAGFEPLGPGTAVLDLEDFIISKNILPIGSFVYLLFCVSRNGWGWKNFLEEANTGKGLKFPKALEIYCKYVLPLIFLIIFIQGYLAL